MSRTAETAQSICLPPVWCLMLYLPSPNGQICCVYEISSYYLHKLSFRLALKAPQPRFYLDRNFFEGFLSTLSLDSLTVVCLSVYFYFAFHTNLWIGSAKSWLSRTQGSVAFLFFSFCFFIVCVCVCVWISFLSWSSCHSCGESYCVICAVSQIYLKATPTSEVCLMSINSLKVSKY